MCGKTGYVVESGNCAASYAIDHAGKGYICVTADSTSSWRCIYDHVALYKQFATGDGDETLSASGNVENG
jgi:D-alanyl-D-alanine carboxypeptidase (penicillin-binding protein 5/6)